MDDDWLVDVGFFDFLILVLLEVQKYFLCGVVILYFFGYKQVIEQFQKVQEFEFDFVFVYWGESFCYNYLLMFECDFDLLCEVLVCLGEMLEECVVKVKMDCECGLFGVVEVLWGEGEVLDCCIVYMEVMERFYEEYFEDQEIVVFYLFLLLVVFGFMGDDIYWFFVYVGVIVFDIFDKNLDYLGVVYYIIYVFDDLVYVCFVLFVVYCFVEIVVVVLYV